MRSLLNSSDLAESDGSQGFACAAGATTGITLQVIDRDNSVIFALSKHCSAEAQDSTLAPVTA